MNDNNKYEIDLTKINAKLDSLTETITLKLELTSQQIEKNLRTDIEKQNDEIKKQMLKNERIFNDKLKRLELRVYGIVIAISTIIFILSFALKLK
jgi:hypothetical protein|nr:MAG TPA: hypothetical protein [Caudoviricetes sp.]